MRHVFAVFLLVYFTFLLFQSEVLSPLPAWLNAHFPVPIRVALGSLLVGALSGAALQKLRQVGDRLIELLMRAVIGG